MINTCREAFFYFCSGRSIVFFSFLAIDKTNTTELETQARCTFLDLHIGTGFLRYPGLWLLCSSTYESTNSTCIIICLYLRYQLGSSWIKRFTSHFRIHCATPLPARAILDTHLTSERSSSRKAFFHLFVQFYSCESVPQCVCSSYASIYWATWTLELIFVFMQW